MLKFLDEVIVETYWKHGQGQGASHNSAAPGEAVKVGRRLVALSISFITKDATAGRCQRLSGSVDAIGPLSLQIL